MENDGTVLTQRLELLKEWNSPRWHTPVNLGIKEFKAFVRGTALSKKAQHFMIKRYKNRAWMTFDGLAQGRRGTFPTHPVYGTRVDVKGTSKSYKIGVNK